MWNVNLFIITICIGLQLTNAQDESQTTVINNDITEQTVQVNFKYRILQH